MPSLSIPSGDRRGGPQGPPPDADAPSRRRRWPELVVRVVAPLGVALVLTWVLVAPGGGMPDADLLLVAPPRAAPGHPVAMRALVLTGVDAGQTPTPRPVPVRVRAHDARGQVVARGRLEPSARQGMEGSLPLPQGLTGPLRLRAEASWQQQTLRVETRLQVSPDARPLPARGRLLSPLQQLTLFPVRPVGDGAAVPSRFEPRVIGGVCVPEHRCDLLVWTSDPDVQAAVEPTRSVQPVEEAAADGPAELQRVAVRVHGAEGRLQLVARRQGAPVARRTVRLPVDQASTALQVEGGSLAKAPARPTLRVRGPGARRGVIVDAFRNGLWERTGSIPGDALRDGAVPVPFAELGPGLWRLQVRTDPYSAASAATRLLYVHDDEDELAALQDIARQLGLRSDDDAYAAIVLSDERPGELPNARRAAFLLAAAEVELVERPDPVSSYEQARRGVRQRASTGRWIGAAAVLVAGAVVSTILLWQGLGASAQARRVMAAAGDTEALGRRRRRRMTWAVVGAVALVVVVFAVVALMVMTLGKG